MRFMFVAALLLIACDKSPTAVAPLVLVVSAGDAQTVTAGYDVSAPVAATVTSNSQPAAGVSVKFVFQGSTVMAVDASRSASGLIDTVVVTDATGTARIRAGWWSPPPIAGVDSLTVSAAGAAPITFTATMLPGSAYGYLKSAGDAQTVPAGSPLATKPAVKVIDEFGNGVPGASVTFTLTSGGGSIAGVMSTTGANGVATLGGWTLGSVPGTNTLTALVQAVGGPGIPFIFTETGVATAVAQRGLFVRPDR